MECTTEIDAVAIAVNETEKGHGTAGQGLDAKKALKGLVESCRWRFEEAICETWSRGEWGRSGFANTEERETRKGETDTGGLF